MAHPFCELEFELPEGGVPALDGYRLQGRAIIPEGVIAELLLSNHLACGGEPAGLSEFVFVEATYCGHDLRRLTSEGTMASLTRGGSLELCALLVPLVSADFRSALSGAQFDQAPASDFLVDPAPYASLAALGLEVPVGYRCLGQVALASTEAHAELSLLGVGGDVTEAALTLEAGFQLARLLNGAPDQRIMAIEELAIPPSSADTSRRLLAYRRADGLIDVAIEVEDDYLVFAGGLRPGPADESCPTLALQGQLSGLVARDFGRLPDPEDSLLASGWTSMDIVRLLNRVTELWGWAPAPVTMRDTPTLAALLEQVEKRLRQPQGEALGLASYAPASDQLSRGEMRLWYLERYAGVAPAYNQCVRIAGPSAWSPTSVLERVAELIDMHEALRTCVRESRGRPRRWVRGDLRLAEVFEQRTTSLEQLDAEVRAFARRPFSMEEGPLFRVLMLQVPGQGSHLVLAAHHVICDGWTMTENLVPYLVGQPELGRGPAWSMADFAAWESRQLHDPGFADGLTELRQRLLEVPHTVELPSDVARPALQSHRGASLRVVLPMDEQVAAVELARREETTLFSALLAMTAVVLGRNAGLPCFLVAIPVALRHTAGLRGTVGCLVNTLPVVVDLRGDPSLGEVIQRVTRSMTESLRTPLLPLDELVAAMGVPRDLSRNPLLQLCVAYRESAAEVPSPFELTEVDTGTSKFDLTVYFTRDAQQLALTVEYATDLYDAQQMERLAQQIRCVLRGAAADATERAMGAVLPTEPERAFLAAAGRGPTTAELAVPGLPGLAEIPAGFGLRQGERHFTAAEVERAIKSVAHRVQTVTDGRETFVAVCCGRSAVFLASILGVMRAGAAYVPLDVRMPALRALRILESARAELLLHDGSADGFAGTFGKGVLRIEDLDDLTREWQPELSPCDAPGSLAYAIPTSGSTGEPKLAVVKRVGFQNMLAWYADLLQCQGDDVVYVVTSVAFDLTQKNLFLALGAGCRLCLHEEGAFDPREICQAISREQATVLNCTPSMFFALLDSAAAEQYGSLRSLRTVVLGGEPLYLERLQTYLSSETCRARIINSYGPSEASDVIAAHVIDPQRDRRGPAPIGRPLPNVELRVEAEPGRLSVLGAVGELCVSGIAVGAGYGSRDGIRPFSPDGMPDYRTGDLVRYRADGALLFVGRNDGQTKLRGQRLDLGDVEATLSAYPGLRELAAKIVEGPSGPLLALFYSTDAAVDEAALRMFAAERLPPVMVPGAFVAMAALPTTSSGKIDRKSLTLPQQRPDASVAAPVEPLEREVLWAFCEVLGLSGLGVHDDFFRLGGHSLLAVALSDQLQESLRMQCRPADVVRYPTPASLAAYLTAQGSAKVREDQPFST